MPLTDQQRRVLYDVVVNIRNDKNTPNQVTVGGYAGTGKTHMIKYMTKFFPDFAVCAYTGKAANVLRRKQIDASTIHSLIYRPNFEHGHVVFDLNPDPECTGFIVDEASMVSEDIYGDLKSFGLPMIFVGDHGQLEPIGSDFNLMRRPDYTLEEIHRNAGDIALFANHLRQGYNARAFRPTDGSVQLLRGVSMRDYMEVDQVICAFNKTRVKVNNQIRQAQGYTGVLNEGERIMCLRNNKKLGLFNGMQGIVTKLYKGKRSADYMDFQTDDRVIEGIKYDTGQFGQESYKLGFGKDTPNPFDYANCITAHKCVHPDTLLETEEGLLPIKSISKTGNIATPDGPKDYKDFVHNPVDDALSIRTKNGQEITMTEDHKVEIWSDTSRKILAKDMQEDDLVRFFIGSQFDQSPVLCPNAELTKGITWDAPKVVDNDVAEFLGLMVADGTIWDRGFRLAKRHIEVVERFSVLCHKLFGIVPKRISIEGTPAAEIHSTFISKWLLSLGGLAPHEKDVPEIILRSSVSVQCSFLRGLFEDGWVSLSGNEFDHVGWHTVHPALCKKVRVMLLRCGIVCGELSTKPDSRLFIYGSYANKFASFIGFISNFKNDRLPVSPITCKYDMIPMNKDEFSGLRKLFMSDPILTLYDYQNGRLRNQLARNKMERLISVLPEPELVNSFQDRLKYYYSRISSISSTSCESMCVEVPDGHRFIQNGFPFWNSQGDEWDKVMVIEQKCSRWDHRRWAYTSASRPKSLLKWKLA